MMILQEYQWYLPLSDVLEVPSTKTSCLTSLTGGLVCLLGFWGDCRYLLVFVLRSPSFVVSE